MEHDPFLPDDAASTPAGAVERACERVLVRLIPSQVHRLNNLVMQSVGRLELVGEGGGETSERVRQPLLELTHRLRHLTLVARGLSATGRVEEVFELLDALLGPLAGELGVALVRQPLASGPLAVPVGFDSALVTLVGRELLLVADDERLAPRDRRVRLRASAGGEGTVVFRLTTVPLGTRSPAAERSCEAALRRGLAAAGIELRFREVGGARSVRLVAPATIEEASSPPPPGPRILLVGEDEVWLEILADVLDEAGYRVVPARSRDEARTRLAERAFDLRLVDGRGLETDPELLSALSQATSADDAGKIGVVGGRPVAGESVLHFAGKLVPAPFLEFVNACLTTS